MVKNQIYDTIGEGYSARRRPDPRISAQISDALGDAKSVINVGAGAGSYEPSDRLVIAVEPSLTMIRQRAPGCALVVQAVAEELPFGDATFDAGMAVLTMHHWSDQAKGLTELMRVVRGQIAIVTYDPASSGFWLVQDYFPEIREIDSRTMPRIEELSDSLGEISVRPLLVPHDCIDGFLGAYWRRPHMYLDDQVRAAISSFSKLTDVESGVERLRSDLSDGTWNQKYGWLLEETNLDIGYRLVVKG